MDIDFLLARSKRERQVLASLEHPDIARLFDFGICELLMTDPLEPADTMTHGMGMMTPDCARPEQVRGEPIPVARDTYSQSALFSERLTGVHAHRMGKYTPRELERAMAKEPIRRYLDNRPVVAASDSIWYRTRKFVDRRQRLVVATSLVVALLSVGLLYAERQRRLAESRLQGACQLANPFVFDVLDAVRDRP